MAKNKVFLGHEFHYATILVEEGDRPLFRVTDSALTNVTSTGLIDGNVAGSFVHLIDQEALSGYK